MGLCNPSEEGLVEYKLFIAKAKEYISFAFNLVTLNTVSKLIHQGSIWMDQAKDCEISNLDLFRNFKLFDRNLFEVLTINEYIDCLRTLK